MSDVYAIAKYCESRPLCERGAIGALFEATIYLPYAERRKLHDENRADDEWQPGWQRFFRFCGHVILARLFVARIL